MSQVITFPVLIRQRGPFRSPSSHCFLSFNDNRQRVVLVRQWKLLEFRQTSWIFRQQVSLWYLNLPFFITNMKLSALVKQTRLNQTTFSALCGFLLHHVDIFPRPEAVNVIHSVLLRGGRTLCWGGHGASVFHHLPIHHNVTQAPACQDSQCALPGVREVWIFEVLNQEMIAMIHSVVWLSYYICWAQEAAS